MYKSKSRIFLTYKPNFALSRVVVLLFFVIACIGCHSFSLVGFVTLAPNIYFTQQIYNIRKYKTYNIRILFFGFNSNNYYILQYII